MGRHLPDMMEGRHVVNVGGVGQAMGRLVGSWAEDFGKRQKLEAFSINVENCLKRRIVRECEQLPGSGGR